VNATVIGAAGFIGAALCAALIKAGHRVEGVDIAFRRPTNDKESFRVLDVAQDRFEISAGTDAVFYLAQSPFYRNFPSQADHLFNVNCMGCVAAAQAAIEAQARFFCYGSTGNVYQPSLAPLSETHPLRRDEPYALSKVMAEDALLLFGKWMRTVSIRFFGVFGPGQGNMLPRRLFELVMSGNPVALDDPPGTERPEGLKVSFCYVDDAVQSLIRLAELALDSAEIPRSLNIAGPEAISIRRFAETIAAAAQIQPIFQLRPRQRAFDLIADVAGMRALLNPSFTPFEDGIRRTFDAEYS
jgi:nucleoside-diphosphate-sugar epimerase